MLTNKKNVTYTVREDEKNVLSISHRRTYSHAINHLQRIRIKRQHCDRCVINPYKLVISAVRQNRRKSPCRLQLIVLWRAMTHCIKRRIHTIIPRQRFLRRSAVGVPMFMTLKYKLHASLLYHIIKRPSLEEVIVLFLHRIKRMMQHYDLMPCFAFLKPFLKPRMLLIEEISPPF